MPNSLNFVTSYNSQFQAPHNPSSISLKVEMSLGKFPYGKLSNIFEQLNAVVNGPPPQLPDDGRFSKELQDFATAW